MADSIYKPTISIARFFQWLLLICGVISVIVPFFWMVLTSFKTLDESTSVNPIVVFPSAFRLEAYDAVMLMFDFPRLYLNTIILIILRVICAVLFASMAGYALARLKFAGKALCFSIVLLQMMVPWQIFILPQYLMVVRLGAVNTMFGLLFPGLTTSFGTFLMRQHFMSLPASLEESARIDGANPMQIFARIMAPLVNAGMTTLGIFTALWAYRDLMWPLIVTPNHNATTLSAALARLQGQSVTYFPDLMAASSLATIPIILIFLIFQKRIIAGIATSGMKL